MLHLHHPPGLPRATTQHHVVNVGVEPEGEGGWPGSQNPLNFEKTSAILPPLFGCLHNLRIPNEDQLPVSDREGHTGQIIWSLSSLLSTSLFCERDFTEMLILEI